MTNVQCPVRRSAAATRCRDIGYWALLIHWSLLIGHSLGIGHWALVIVTTPLPHRFKQWLIVTVMSQPPSQSAEDYLERIHELIEEKGYARVVDIASSLKVKQASVTSMVQKLGELGYLNYEKYRGLILTPKGREVACRIQKRHETLSRFFSLFGLDAKTQQHDIEGIEHHLSPATAEVLSDLARFFEKNPETLKAFVQSRKQPKR